MIRFSLIIALLVTLSCALPQFASAEPVGSINLSLQVENNGSDNNANIPDNGGAAGGSDNTQNVVTVPTQASQASTVQAGLATLSGLVQTGDQAPYRIFIILATGAAGLLLLAASRRKSEREIARVQSTWQSRV